MTFKGLVAGTLRCAARSILELHLGRCLADSIRADGTRDCACYLGGCLIAILLAGQVVADENVDEVVALDDVALDESSGLTFSRRDANCVWTHNDSGDSARLFCFDRTTGERTGTCRLLNAEATDWEAMTSIVESRGQIRSRGQNKNSGREQKTDTIVPLLVVADCGDNLRQRSGITLYRFAEPAPNADSVLEPGEWSKRTVRFPNGSLDCEAMWYDESDYQIVLLAKSLVPIVGAYGVSMNVWGSATYASEPILAKRLAFLPIPAATGADRDPASGDVWVVNYWQTFRFRRHADDNLLTQLARTPDSSYLPRWKQIEAVAVDAESNVWVTTEGSPAKLGRLK